MNGTDLIEEMDGSSLYQNKNRVLRIIYNNKKQKMGSKSLAQFKPPSDFYVFLDYKYCKVWVRKSDKVQQLEQYTIIIHNQSEYQQYQKMFLFRLEQHYFPSTLYFLSRSSSSVCGNSKLGSILIQRIPYRLCQFKNLFYSDAVSIMSMCLKGYNILYQKYGIFKPKTTMICIDSNYHIKVWHHTDLSSPYPEDPYCSSLIQMIEHIISSVEKISAHPLKINRFSEYLQNRSLKLFSFQLAIKILQQYAFENGIKITDQLKNIEKFLKQASGPTSMGNKFNRNHSQEYKGSSKSKSIPKYSFRNNNVINQQINPSQQNSASSLYYNANSKDSLNSSFRSSKSNEKQQFPKFISTSSPFYKDFNTQQKSFKPPFISNNTYNERFYQRVLMKSPQNSSQNSRFLQRLNFQTRMNDKDPLRNQSKGVNNFLKMNKVSGVNKIGSSSNDYTETKQTKSREPSSSIHSLMTLLSAESASFRGDEQVIRNLSKMLRNNS